MDHHATTPVDPRALEAMLPHFSTVFGNAASQHAFGWAAHAAVELARESVAELIGAPGARDIVFTSGTTEANNLALKGVTEYYRQRRDHVVTTVIEHHSVLDVCRRLEQRGLQVTYVKVASDGKVDPADIERALTDRTLLVSVMLGNNEIGTIAPIAEIGAITRPRGVLLHCDASQGLGVTPFDVERMNVDLASLSAHKLYGPKGAGALYVRGRNPRVRLTAELDGGGHERGMRSGTLNVPAIVGFGAACRLLAELGPAEGQRLRRHRDRLYRSIVGAVDAVVLNGPDIDRAAFDEAARGTAAPDTTAPDTAAPDTAAFHTAISEETAAPDANGRDRAAGGTAPSSLAAAASAVDTSAVNTARLPGNLNLSFLGLDSAALISELKHEVAVSSGSACSSLTLEPSHVIRTTAGEERARCSLRFGLGRFTTDEEVDYVAEAVVRAVRALRGAAAG
jgi:cysteine desulfurase